VSDYSSSQLDALLVTPDIDLSQSQASENNDTSRFKPYMAVAFIPLAITLTAIPTVYKNRHLFLSPIELTTDEKQHLPVIRHQLRSVNNYQSKPVFNKKLSRPVVLVGQNHFLNKWQSVLNQKADVIACNATLALTCDTRRIRKIYIIDMRGRSWEQVLLLLKDGHNVIAYGADENFDSRITSALGLRSSNSEASKSSYLSLVSDKELTLGITHSPTLYVGSSATTQTIKSNNPQAISMLPDRRPGGFSIPRLHTKSYEGSRFVWMDFLPEIDFANNESNADIFKQIIANIVRYIDDQQYEHIATWPHNKTASAFIAVDANEESQNSDNFINKYASTGSPLTTFINTKFAFENRDSSNRLAKLGELGCMAHLQDLLTRYSSADQTKKNARCKKVVNKITGRNISGFRPPLESFNQNTLNSIINSGLSYIYAAKSTDSNLPEISESHMGNRLVRIPRVSSDGFLLWETLELSDEATLKRLIDEFDWTKLSGGLFGFTFNLNQLINKERTNVIIALAEVMEQNDVYFSTLEDISNWWLLRQALATQTKELDAKQRRLIRKYKPSVLFVDPQGRLRRKAFSLSQ